MKRANFSTYLAALVIATQFGGFSAMAWNNNLPGVNVKVTNYSDLSFDQLQIKAAGDCGLYDTSNFFIGACGSTLLPMQRDSTNGFSIQAASIPNNFQSGFVVNLLNPYAMKYFLDFSIRGITVGSDFDNILRYPVQNLTTGQTIQFVYLRTKAHSLVYKLKGGGNAADWIKKNTPSGQLFLEMSIRGGHCGIMDFSSATDELKIDHLNLPAHEYILTGAEATGCGLNLQKPSVVHVSLKAFSDMRTDISTGDDVGINQLSDVEFDRTFSPDILSGLGDAIELNVNR